MNHPPEPRPLDSVAKSALCESVGGVVTDAASDEFRAFRLGTGASTSVFVDGALLPNVVLHGKDPTHANGRFLKVWKHDPCLNEVFDLFVWGADSFAKLIANSPDISRRFAATVQGIARFVFSRTCFSGRLAKPYVCDCHTRISSITPSRARASKTRSSASRGTTQHRRRWLGVSVSWMR